MIVRWLHGKCGGIMSASEFLGIRFTYGVSPAQSKLLHSHPQVPGYSSYDTAVGKVKVRKRKTKAQVAVAATAKAPSKYL